MDRRNLFFLLMTQFAIAVALGISVPLLPIFLDSVGVTAIRELAVWSSAVFFVGVFASMLAAPFWGRFGDRYGLQTNVARACIGLLISLLMLSFAHSPFMVFVWRFGQGLISGVQPAIYAYALGRVATDRSGRVLGYLDGIGGFGALIGPLIGAFIINSVSIAASYRVAAFFALAGLLLSFGLSAIEKSAKGERANVEVSFKWGDALRQRGFRDLIILAILIALLDRIVEQLYPLWLMERVTTSADRTWAIAILEAVGEGGYMLAAPLLGILVGRTQPWRLIFWGIVVSTLATFWVPLVTLPSMVVISAVCCALVHDGASSAVYPSLQRSVVDEDQRKNLGFRTALLGSAIRGGNGLGALAVIPLIQIFGLSMTWIVVGAVSFLLAVSLGVKDKRIRNKHDAATFRLGKSELADSFH